jgi:hypothetical protein
MKPFSNFLKDTYNLKTLLEEYNLVPLEEWVHRETVTDHEGHPVKVFNTDHSAARENEGRNGLSKDHVENVMKSAALHARKMGDKAPQHPALYYSVHPDGSKQGVIAHYDKDRRPERHEDPEKRHMYTLTVLPKNKIVARDRDTKVVKVPYHKPT